MDLLQPCLVGHHFPLSHLQSSSNTLNGSRSEASSTASQSVTGSELAAVNGNDLFECSTIGKPSLLMNGHINQGNVKFSIISSSRSLKNLEGEGGSSFIHLLSVWIGQVNI